MWRRWHTPQNFCLAFDDELEKQLFIEKMLRKKKEKKNAWRDNPFTHMYHI